MVNVCMDCRYCLSFSRGFRIACLHPLLKANTVYNFYPLEGGRDAWECGGFEDGSPIELEMEELYEAERWGLAAGESFQGEPKDGGYCLSLRQWYERVKCENSL